MHGPVLCSLGAGRILAEALRAAGSLLLAGSLGPAAGLPLLMPMRPSS